MRYHEGEVTTLDATYNAKRGTITFETDRFSTYAVVILKKKNTIK